MSTPIPSKIKHLFEPGEKVIGQRTDDGTLIVVTSSGRKVSIELASGEYTILSGPAFPVRPAEAPETDTP